MADPTKPEPQKIDPTHAYYQSPLFLFHNSFGVTFHPIQSGAMNSPSSLIKNSISWSWVDWFYQQATTKS